MRTSGVMQRLRPGAPWAILSAWALAWSTIFGASPAYAFDWNTSMLTIPSGSDTLQFTFNPASGDVPLLANQCAFTVAGVVCEGATANAFEGRLVMPDVATADKDWTLPDASGQIVLDTAAQTLTNKTITSAANTLSIDGTSITSGTIPAARHGADFVDAMSDIDAAIKTSDTDTKLLTTAQANPASTKCLEITSAGSVQQASGACSTSTPVRPILDATSETKISITGAGSMYLTPNGRITASETDCRVPVPDGTYDNISVLASANQTASDLSAEVGKGACGSALTYAGTLKAVFSATANTRVAATGAITTTGGQCMCVKVTSVAGMPAAAYLSITWERTA